MARAGDTPTRAAWGREEKGARADQALHCTQDLWMFPVVLLLQPEAARALLQYRIQTLAGALDNARNLGYQVRGTWVPSLLGPF